LPDVRAERARMMLSSPHTGTCDPKTVDEALRGLESKREAIAQTIADIREIEAEIANSALSHELAARREELARWEAQAKAAEAKVQELTQKGAAPSPQNARARRSARRERTHEQASQAIRRCDC
jgi:DNA repair exonuclease SbcCD ATPase subunit